MQACALPGSSRFRREPDNELVFQSLTDTLCDRLDYLHTGIPLVICRYNDPRSMVKRGLLEKILGRIVVLVPMIPITPVLVTDFPMLVGIGFSAFESVELLILGDVKLELDDDHAVVA